MRESVSLLRIISTPAALDGAAWPRDTAYFRTAPDAAVVLGDEAPALDDPDAVVFEDTSWETVVLAPEIGSAVMAAHATWPPPAGGFAQGAVAGIGVKLWVDSESWLFLVPGAYGFDFAERIAGVVT